MTGPISDKGWRMSGVYFLVCDDIAIFSALFYYSGPVSVARSISFLINAASYAMSSFSARARP